MILDTNRSKYTNKYIMKTDKLDDSCTKSYDQKAKCKSCTIFTKCNNQRSKEGTFSFLREQSQDWWSGCTNVGIIKNFLSIQIQEQEQGARSMCFQTWSNEKKDCVYIKL